MYENQCQTTNINRTQYRNTNITVYFYLYCEYWNAKDSLNLHASIMIMSRMPRDESRAKYIFCSSFLYLTTTSTTKAVCATEAMLNKDEVTVTHI